MTHNSKDHCSAITLNNVLLAFKQWRQHPDKSRMIPATLWDQVFQLLPYYGIGKILSTLSISSAQFKKQRQKRQLSLSQRASNEQNECIETEQAESVGTFIKAKVIHSSTAGVTSNVTVAHDITLTKPNGTSLHIQQLPYHEILNLVQQFVE